MKTRFDERFIFNEWNESLMNKLLLQQERLKLNNVDRQVCVLVDDIIMSSRHEEEVGKRSNFVRAR